MNFRQISSAFADTATSQSASSDSTGSQLLESLSGWTAPAVITVLLAALIAAVAPYLKDLAIQRRQRRLARKADETAESLYLQWVIRNFKYIPFRGYVTRSRAEVELERVYVSLSVDHRSAEQSLHRDDPPRFLTRFLPGSLMRKKHQDLTIAEAMKFLKRDEILGLVILGGPGTGKTTLLKYLALTYSRVLQRKRLRQSQRRLPVFVTLRTIAIDDGGPSLDRYLTDICSNAGIRVSPGFFNKKLKDGACIVLLDGLDEVADEAQREQIAGWIEKQWVDFGENPFVVTCRPSGFREEYLRAGFLRLDIQDFNENDIAKFARNWCLAVERSEMGRSRESRRRGREAGENLIGAIRSNEHVSALATNPLMLSIIALVHRYRAALPERRVDLYSECVQVMLGRWEAAKGLPVEVPPDKALQILKPLALWMHKQQAAKEGKWTARRYEVEAFIASYLVNVGMQDKGAGGFLDYMRDRCGLLVEREPGVVSFHHQTFQEYLAAEEIEACGKTGLLVDRFGDDYWREITLLYAGIGDISGLIRSLCSLPDEALTDHRDLLLQIRNESRPGGGGGAEALASRFLEILQQASDPNVAARAAVFLRHGQPDLDHLVGAFEEAQGDLAKGHLALLLGETGDVGVAGILKPHLMAESSHVRYLSALALDMLGFGDREALDNLLMATVPVGEFTMGSEEGYADEKPQRQVSTGAFQIDRFPLTNAQYRRFIEAGGYQERRYWSRKGWWWKLRRRIKEPGYVRDPQFNMLSAPVVGISWYEAEAYANWAGKRLPTEEEWERAARGDLDARAYPWEGEFDESRCNVAGESWEPIIGQPTPVGSYPGGVSSHGCYDMAGNVWEWTSSLYKSGENWRVLRGGSWFYSSDVARCASRNGLDPVSRRHYVGVRFSRTL